jgi:hypothetical protein
MDIFTMPVALGTGIPLYLSAAIWTARRAYRDIVGDWYEDTIEAWKNSRGARDTITQDAMYQIDTHFRDSQHGDFAMNALGLGLAWPVTWTLGFIFHGRPQSGLEAATRKELENTALREKLAAIERDLADDLQHQIDSLEKVQRRKEKAKRLKAAQTPQESPEPTDA